MADSHSLGSAVSIDFGNDRVGDAVAELITVHLAYAENALRQHYLTISVNKGTVLYEALAQSGWLSQFPELSHWCEQVAHISAPAPKLWHVGIYAQKQPLNYVLQPLDRIEVYRSLTADPMSRRKNKTTQKTKINQ